MLSPMVDIDNLTSDPIDVTLLDTVTGKTARGAKTAGSCSWAWAGGNFNCDCNRFYAFDIDAAEEPEGCESKRFLVVAASGTLSGFTVADMNNDYPLELCRKHPESMQGAARHNMMHWERIRKGLFKPNG